VRGDFGAVAAAFGGESGGVEVDFSGAVTKAKIRQDSYQNFLRSDSRSERLDIDLPLLGVCCSSTEREKDVLAFEDQALSTLERGR
jgi:hypothetical protein